MSADPTSEKKPALRPLPSVGMALLPNELRARRTKRLVVSGVVGAVILGFVFVWLVRGVLPETWAWVETGLDPDEGVAALAIAATDGIAVTDPDGGIEEELSPEESLALRRSSPNARYETLFGSEPSFRGALLNAGLEVLHAH